MYKTPNRASVDPFYTIPSLPSVPSWDELFKIQPFPHRRPDHTPPRGPFPPEPRRPEPRKPNPVPPDPVLPKVPKPIPVVETGIHHSDCRVLIDSVVIGNIKSVDIKYVVKTHTYEATIILFSDDDLDTIAHTFDNQHLEVVAGRDEKYKLARLSRIEVVTARRLVTIESNITEVELVCILHPLEG